jgi:hypothetical protein
MQGRIDNQAMEKQEASSSGGDIFLRNVGLSPDYAALKLFTVVRNRNFGN